MYVLISQGFMYLFGAVAIAFAVYGLATVDKSVTDGAFNVLTTVSDYAQDAFNILDDLLNTIKGTSDMWVRVVQPLCEQLSACITQFE